MVVCEYEPLAAAEEHTEPPTKQAIEEHRQRQLQVLKDLRKRLAQTVRVAAIRAAW